MRTSTIAGVIFSAAAVLALGSHGAVAQICRWDGLAPFCAGECGPGESEVARASSFGELGRLDAVNPFGEACLTGTKAYCCETASRICRWDGVAPFCHGICEDFETQGSPPAGLLTGASCVTGAKAYCCHSPVTPVASTLRLRLEASPEFARFTALWEQGPGFPWQARHGLDAVRLQLELDTLLAQGYRPVEISGYSVGGVATYAAIWEQRPGPPWQTRFGLTAAQLQQQLNALAAQGYRPIDVSGYAVAGEERYAAIWEQQPGPAWQARYGQSAGEYQQASDTLTAQGYRLVDISGTNIGGEDRYAAIWELSEGPAWQARHGMTPAEFQLAINSLTGAGYRLSRISGWRSGETVHYAALWQQRSGPAWVARHGLLADAYQEAFDLLTADGYRLVRVSGYHSYD